MLKEGERNNMSNRVFFHKDWKLDYIKPLRKKNRNNKIWQLY